MVRTNFLMTAPLLMASFCSAQEKPNVVLILVDDMGYSDIGCYGGEILTPNIDALASKGVRFTQFYNTSRSCPARASLMTGLYQHQAGIGQMSEDPFANPDQKSPNDWGVQGYKGYLNRNCVTIAEVLKEDGYHTYMAGKWHLGMHGEEKWPLQRGFERFYGILSGACSYLRPSGGRGLTLDNTNFRLRMRLIIRRMLLLIMLSSLWMNKRMTALSFSIWLSMLLIGRYMRKRKIYRNLQRYIVRKVGMKFGKHGVNGWQRWGLLIQIQTLPNGKTGNGTN